jgi:hypothetical protein
MTAVLVTSALGISPFSSFQALGQRKPLPRPRLDKISFQPTGVRSRFDPTTRTYEEYKVEGTISRDARTGNFLLQWTGSDGKKKVIVYEPPVGVDAVVAARVEGRTGSNIHRYTYTVSNLKSSDQKLHSFYVEASLPTENAVAPDKSWYLTPLTGYLQSQLHVPSGWTWSQVRDGRLGLEPGETVTGLASKARICPAS